MLSLEIIVATAYILEREKSVEVPPSLLEELRRDPEYWPHKVTRRVCTTLVSEVCPTYLMPEREDLELQFRRGVGTVRY